MKYRDNMNPNELAQFKKELNELDLAYEAAAENDVKTASKRQNSSEDPTDYVGMGWVDSKGRP